MKKEWVELASVVGLLAGLIFVGFEIRQNTQALQGGTVQAAAEMQIEMILRGMEDPIIQGAWQRLEDGSSMTEFTEQEQMKLGWFFAALTSLEENRFRQIQLGTADEKMLGLVNNYLANTGFREWWGARLSDGRDHREPDFVEYLGHRIEEASARASSGGPPEPRP